jgi:hypothetical protein
MIAWGCVVVGCKICRNIVYNLAYFPDKSIILPWKFYILFIEFII